MSTVTMSECGTKITVSRAVPTKSVFTYLYHSQYADPDTVVKFPGDDFALVGYPGVSSAILQQGMEEVLTKLIEAAGTSYVN